MNKQDIRFLRLVSKRDQIEPTVQSTKLIMAEAQRQSTRAKERHHQLSSQSEKSSLWSLNGAVFQQLSSAAFSILFTLGVFLTLHHALTPQPLDTTAGESAPTLRFEIVGREPEASSLLSIADIPKPERHTFRDATHVAQLRPLLTASMDILIEHQVTVDGLDIAVSKSLIQDAMFDITQHIRQGKIDDARLRYERLKLACEPCLLPASLEALAYLTEPHGQSG